jgi:hypothetical protein
MNVYITLHINSKLLTFIRLIWGYRVVSTLSPSAVDFPERNYS